MDKDNRDDFTFAKLSDLKVPVTFRMYLHLLSRLSRPYISFLIQWLHSSQLEGIRKPHPFTEVLEKPELRLQGIQQAP